MHDEPVELPWWVYDLIKAVEEFEYTHAQVPRAATCLAPAWEKVPAWARRDAALLDDHRTYLARSTKEPAT